MSAAVTTPTKNDGRMLSRQREVLLHVVLMCATAFALYPILWVVKVSLSVGSTFADSILPIPTSISFAHYQQVLLGDDGADRSLFLKQVLNSLVVSTATTIVGITLSCSAAYAFSRRDFALKNTSLTALMVTQIFPGVLMLVPLYLLLDFLHLLNTLTSLVIVYSTTSVPFCTWMLKGYFDTIPRDMEEAAMIDGASPLRIFLVLVLPVAKPAIAVTALFSFMTAWNEFVLAATLMNDAALFTLPVALQRYVGEYETNWGAFAAGAVIASAPVMALFYVLQKHLVGGLTAGSVKG